MLGEWRGAAAALRRRPCLPIPSPMPLSSVAPAKAGVQSCVSCRLCIHFSTNVVFETQAFRASRLHFWTPAFAGATVNERGRRRRAGGMWRPLGHCVFPPQPPVGARRFAKKNLRRSRHPYASPFPLLPQGNSPPLWHPGVLIPPRMPQGGQPACFPFPVVGEVPSHGRLPEA